LNEALVNWWTSTNVSNLCSCFQFHPNLNEAFLIGRDLAEAAGTYPNAPNLPNYF